MLIGDRIRLVSVTEQNIRELHDLWNDPALAGEYGGFTPMSWDEFSEKFAKGASWFLIEKTSDNETVGWIDYFWTRIDYPHLWEIGYTLKPSERRKGYMTEVEC